MENYDLMQDGQQKGLRDFLTFVFKHKKKILIVFPVIVGVVTAISFLLTPIYEAQSSILVKIGREYLTRPEGGNTPVMALSQEGVSNSEIQILTNRNLIGKVITSLKLENIYPQLLENPTPGINPLDAAITKFQKALTVEGVKKSNVIQVTFQHKDPQISARAVNLLVELYKEKHLQVFSDPKSSFLELQLSEYDQKLKASENSLQTFKQKAGVFSLEDQRKLLLEQRSAQDASLKSTQNSIHELQKKVATLKRHMTTLSNNKASYTSSDRERIIVDAQAKQLALQLNENELLKKYTENNRLVVNARKEIQMVKDFMKEQEEDINRKVKTSNPVYQNTEIDLIKAETELSAQKGKAISLTQQLSQIDQEIRALDYNEKEMQQLKREQTINEKNYQTYMDKTEEARIADDMNRLKMANISVIQEAGVPVEPVKPQKLIIISLGIVFGALSALGLAFISETTSQSFSTPERVEKRLALPVLAVISLKER